MVGAYHRAAETSAANSVGIRPAAYRRRGDGGPRMKSKSARVTKQKYYRFLDGGAFQMLMVAVDIAISATIASRRRWLPVAFHDVAVNHWPYFRLIGHFCGRPRVGRWRLNSASRDVCRSEVPLIADMDDRQHDAMSQRRHASCSDARRVMGLSTEISSWASNRQSAEP